MVWIHGGRFLLGSGNHDIYGSDYIVQKNVVLVTINYRLGVFGMFFHPSIFKIVTSLIYGISVSFTVKLYFDYSKLPCKLKRRLTMQFINLRNIRIVNIIISNVSL